MSAQLVEWEPGDPLYPDPNSAHQRFLYNFRDDPNTEREECRCPDAARWPTPKMERALSPVDELGDFITEWKAWRRSQGLPVPRREPVGVVAKVLAHLGVTL